MLPRPTSPLTVVLIALLWALGPTAVRAQTEDRVRAGTLYAAHKTHVYYLSGVKDLKEEVFTGFVIDDGTLITAAHSARKSDIIQLRLPTGGFVMCEKIQVRDDLDLAALRVLELPKGVTLNPLSRRPPAAPATVNEFAMLVGYPKGMSEWFDYGTVTSVNKTRGQLGEELTGKKQTGPGLDFKVIQHTVASMHGCSGAPLLDGEGRVIGVHSGGLGDETKFGLAVPIEYVDLMDRKKASQPPTGQPLRALPTHGTVPHGATRAKPAAVPAPVPAVVAPPKAGVPDLWCYLRGDLPRDPEVIWNNFIVQKERFRDGMGQGRIGEILEHHDAIVKITNPAFRFSFLSPCCYAFDQRVSAAPEGVAVRLTMTEPPDDPLNGVHIAPAFRELHLLAWRMHEPVSGKKLTDKDYVRQLLRNGKAVRDGKDLATRKPLDTYPAGDNTVETQLRLIAELAPMEFFGFTVRPGGTPPGPLRGMNEVVAGVLTDGKPAVVPGRRAGRMYASFDRLRAFPGLAPQSPVVLYGIHDGVVVVGWFEAVTELLQGFNVPAAQGGLVAVPPDLVERMFLLLSVSFH